MKTRDLLFTMLLLGSTTVAHAQENLMKNPGFEGETIVIDETHGIIHPTDWFCFPDQFTESDTHYNTIIDEAHTGNAGIYFLYAVEGYPSRGYISQSIDIVSGLDKTYTFSFWYKIDKGSNYKGYPIEWKYGMSLWNSAKPTEISFADDYSGQGMVLSGETVEGDWKFVTMDYDSKEHLDKFTPTMEIKDKSELRYLNVGVLVRRGNMLVDDFSLTVKGNTNGIGSTTANQPLPVKVDGGELYVGGVKGSRICVYDPAGRTLVSTVATGGTTRISNLPKRQLLMVKAGNKTAKVIVK